MISIALSYWRILQIRDRQTAAVSYIQKSCRSNKLCQVGYRSTDGRRASKIAISYWLAGRTCATAPHNIYLSVITRKRGSCPHNVMGSRSSMHRKRPISTTGRTKAPGRSKWNLSELINHRDIISWW
jgi:hypothetical protein